MTTNFFEWLLGTPNHDNLTPDWILQASDEELERRHDWVQWAFPINTMSRFNPEAPLVTERDMRSMTKAQLNVYRDLVTRYVQFLSASKHWRSPGDHNHLRITRLIISLRLAGMHDRAGEIYRIACDYGHPTPTSRRFWDDAMGMS